MTTYTATTTTNNIILKSQKQVPCLVKAMLHDVFPPTLLFY